MPTKSGYTGGRTGGTTAAPLAKSSPEQAAYIKKTIPEAQRLIAVGNKLERDMEALLRKKTITPEEFAAIKARFYGRDMVEISHLRESIVHDFPGGSNVFIYSPKLDALRFTGREVFEKTFATFQIVQHQVTGEEIFVPRPMSHTGRG